MSIWMFLPLFSGLGEKEMRDVFGILLLFVGAVTGTSQDPVVCRFNQSQCYIAVGQRLHLQIPLVDMFQLKTSSIIFKYNKDQSKPPTPISPRWQFDNDNKIMILTSAERSDSGNYTLDTFDAGGTNKGIYNLQLIIEDFTLAILSTVSVLLIVLFVLAIFIYKKRQCLKCKRDPAQDVNTESATVVFTSNQRNQMKNENEEQYSELVFNTPASKKSDVPKVQVECVYSQVQHGQSGTHSPPLST